MFYLLCLIPFAGCVWNTVPNREVLPLQVTHDQCMNKKRSISRTLDAWNRYRKTLWIFSCLQNMCNFIIEAVLQSTNSGDETAEKRQYHWRPHWATNLRESTGIAERWTETGWNRKKIPVIITCTKQSAKWMWIFLS